MPQSVSEKKNKKSAMEAATAYLANRMRTAFELRKHLKEKEYTQEEIESTVEELKELRYLDDYQYALRYYEYNREKKRGPLRAERELYEKGIDKETIQNAKEDFLYEQKVDEYEDALAVAKRELPASADIYGETETMTGFDDRLAAKVARKLESRGFSRSDIFRVLDTLRRKSEE